MQITRLDGKHGVVCYDLRNDDAGFVARFDSLEDAAQVARYIVGANMGDDERQHALKAMQTARVLGRGAAAAGDNQTAQNSAEME